MAKKKQKQNKKATNITPEELTEMRKLVTQSNNGHLDLGRLSMQKHRILHALATVQDEITLFQQKLEEKYGEAEINTVDGSITYKEDGKVNS
jgi:hypothetical protein